MRYLICLVLLLPVPVIADTTDAAPTNGTSDSTTIDTVLFRPGQLLQPYNEVTNAGNREMRLTQNPTLGLFKSMLVPGWGQMGNRRYLKAVVFAGLDAWFLVSTIHYGQQASDFRRQFENATDISERNDLYNLYQDRRDNRNKFTWFAVITTFVAMFDAYVDAHLSGFPRIEQSDNISVHVEPLLEGGVAANISVGF
jgi:hypothetical protein